MGKKVFVSHATADKQIVSWFVDHILCSGSGVNIEDVLYTSREDSGIVNGEDIPQSIKNGIKQCELFFMMVSKGYRQSEVCLNEMGAAWMDDKLPKKIMLLPDVDFDQIGWLISLKKGTKISDSAGLDAIHDQIMDVMSAKIQTVTWNRHKELFLQKIQSITSQEVAVQDASVIDDEDEKDFLDIRAEFDKCCQDIITIMSTLTNALNVYGSKMNQVTEEINKIVEKPKSFTPDQVRVVLKKGAKEADHLSEIIENKSPILRESFNEMMKYAIEIHKYDIGDEVKSKNRNENQQLIDAMMSVRDTFVEFKGILTNMVDLDKSYKKSKNRLIDANNQMIEVLSFCISRATEYQMA